MKSKGLGDTIAKGIKATGIVKFTSRLTGGPCGGCKERQEALNKKYPYKSI